MIEAPKELLDRVATNMAVIEHANWPEQHIGGQTVWRANLWVRGVEVGSVATTIMSSGDWENVFSAVGHDLTATEVGHEDEVSAGQSIREWLTGFPDVSLDQIGEFTHRPKYARGR